MPRCRNAAWCIDDLCHFTEQTLCGLWVGEDIDHGGEWITDDDEMFGPDDDAYVANQALGRTHPYGNGAL